MAPLLTQRLHAEDLFSGLRPEDEQSRDKKLEVKKTPGLDRIIKGFENCIKKYKYPIFSNISIDEFITEESKKDIRIFCNLLKHYEDHINFEILAGGYLSGLANKSFDREFDLNLKPLNKKLKYLGNNNKKILRVYGDVGDNLGYLMTSGAIVVSGDVGKFVGDIMSGGFININGDVGENTGYLTSGGLITINGNSLSYLGHNMKGGSLIINGFAGDNVSSNSLGNIFLNRDYGSISQNQDKGNIFHKGKQLIRDGKPVPGVEIKWT